MSPSLSKYGWCSFKCIKQITCRKTRELLKYFSLILGCSFRTIELISVRMQCWDPLMVYRDQQTRSPRRRMKNSWVIIESADSKRWHFKLFVKKMLLQKLFFILISFFSKISHKRCRKKVFLCVPVSVGWTHRDRSIHLVIACQLHGMKITLHGLQHKGFNISLMGMYIEFFFCIRTT